MNLLSTIEASGYAAVTDKQIEALARHHAKDAAALEGVRGTYLRVVVAHVQAALAHTPATETADQLGALETVHARLYPAVLRGITTEEVADVETLDTHARRMRALARNARSSFARSAVSTLRSYIKAGGDMRKLDVRKVSKTSLRAAFAPAAATPEQRLALRRERALGALSRAVDREAKSNPKGILGYLANAIQQLQAKLESLAEAQRPRRRGRPKATVGRPGRGVGRPRRSGVHARAAAH